MKRYLEAIKLGFAHYKQPLCLKDISFTVSKGKKILVLGVGETGKTTLLKSLCGFDSTYFGEVRFADKNIKQISDEEKNFSLLLSKPVFIAGTIRKNLDFLCETLKREKLTNEELVSLLAKFKIEKTAGDKIKSLSLVEQRKLAMARTYLKKPNAVFVDDQFAGFEESERVQIEESLNVLFELDTTFVIASGEQGYLENVEFYKSANFESVLYLSLLKSYRYKTLEEFELKKINFDVMKFVDTHKTIDGYVMRRNGAYYFGMDDSELLIKFDKVYCDKLSLLSMVDEETENVKLCVKNEINFDEVNDSKFNKYLKLGDFLLYSALDGSRVI